MAKLYYGGDGNCSIEGSDIRGVHIKFSGAIEIDDRTSDSFAIAHHKNGIVVFPIGDGFLNELFNYEGEFKIISVMVGNSNFEKEPTTIHRVMDYAELLTTNAEDMTTNSEDLSSTYISGRKVAKTILKQPYINNQHTLKHDGELYLQDGTLYNGDFHIHLSDSAAMTGNTHTEDSEDLYYNNGKPTKNPKLIPYGIVEQNKSRKAQQIKNKRLRNKKAKRRGAY